MKIFIFLFLFISLAIPSFAQNTLELKNTQTGKSRILKPGAKLFFKTAQDSVFIKGKIVQIKDTSIVIYCPDNDEEMPLVDVNIKNITVIKKPTAFHAFTRTTGAVLTPAGGFVFLTGLFTLTRDNDEAAKNQAVVFAVAGLGAATAGLIPYVVKPKTYDLKKDWTLTVKKTR